MQSSSEINAGTSASGSNTAGVTTGAATSTTSSAGVTIGPIQIPLNVLITVIPVVVVTAIAVGVTVPLVSRNNNNNDTNDIRSQDESFSLRTASPSSTTSTAAPSIFTPNMPTRATTTTSQPVAISAEVDTSEPTMAPSESQINEVNTGAPSLSTMILLNPEEDPFYNSEESFLWRPLTFGSGINLEVINAMDETWRDLFNTVVLDWDESDALTLATISDKIDESFCQPVDGKIKVCNGNYGQTGWAGISKVLLQNGWIYSATVQMNEFYLQSASAETRRYFLCHNIGHAFGLPHSDENFQNVDINDCLDFTENPAANQRPGYISFQRLNDLYGKSTPTPLQTPATVIPSPFNPTTAPSESPRNEVNTVAPTLSTMILLNPEEDPFYNSDESFLWRQLTLGSGINLEVINSMDETWRDLFNTVVLDWDKSDALTLVTISDEIDESFCQPVDGKIKVCNGNYGQTGWAGICKILLQNGGIFSATVQMNEYYLQSASVETRRYFLCHNIGHAFGLSHSDEIFQNMDMNDCLDFTENPAANQRPGDISFQRLIDLYGGRTSPTPLPVSPASAANAPNSMPTPSTQHPTSLTFQIVQIFDEDPFEDSPDLIPWQQSNTTDGYVSLQIADATDDSWKDLLNVVIADWDRSDRLVLNMTRIDVERDCSFQEGIIKVCNDNYGDTQWKGINKVLIQDGFIYAAAVQLNEFYLQSETIAARRYTLCHEIGHAFGLPHSDENFNNMDLNDCMDNTVNHEVNQFPGDISFQRLDVLYGND